MERRGVLGVDAGRRTAEREELIRSAISGWRVSLIDFTGGNQLLDFRAGGTNAVKVARPAAGDVLAHLAAGGTFAFRSLQPWAAAADGVPPPAPYLLDTGMDPDDLDAALRALMRRSERQYLEGGLPVLYLAFGVLWWADRDGARYSSPLLLVPARLVAGGPRQPPMLESAAGDLVVNPALGLKLSRYRIRLPAVGDLAEVRLGGLLEAVRAAVATQGDWVVDESVALSWFPPMKEAMYQDLVDHEDLVAAHPLVKALAAQGLTGAGPAFDGIGEPAAGGHSAGEAIPLVLPADSSQLVCISAALAGQSFVMDGPPGTGKTQTIANMIGALLCAGKTVLVVSEKAVALEAVAGRLTAAGLGGYLLELHSGKEARNQVASSLAEAMDMVPAAPAAALPQGTGGASTRPKQLSAYAEAVHRVRDPLGYSLHDVLTVIASLHAVPAAHATGRAPVHLTPEALGEIRRAAAALAAAWRPAVQGRPFPWRSVTEPGPQDERLYQAASALETLAAVAQVNQPLIAATGLARPSDAHALARLLGHLEQWPQGVPDAWLTADELDAVDAAITQLSAALTTITARESQASQAAGIPWSAIPQPGPLPADGVASLAALGRACADVSGLTAEQITELAQKLSAAAGLLEKWREKLSGLASVLGLRVPVTFADADDLLALAGLAAVPDHPERSWLSATGQLAASSAARVLHRAHRTLATAEADARTYFTPEAPDHDPAGLAQRLAHDRRSLSRLSGDHRAARKTVRAFTRVGIAEETALEHLGLAAAWQQAAETLAAAEASHAALLGRYYSGRATDFARLARALGHAAAAVSCAHGQDLSQAADYICPDAAPHRDITAVAAEARRDVSAWQAALAQVPTIASHPALLNGTITGAIGWLRAHQEPLRATGEFTRSVTEAVGRPLTAGQARRLVALREAADSAHAQLAARDAIFQDLCGPFYTGAATDLPALRDGLEWARRLRKLITGTPGPLTPAHLAAAESAVPTGRLDSAADAWQQACAALLEAFTPDRRQELAAELDDYQAGGLLLEAMFNDTSGPGEWHAYQAARAALAVHGLDAAVGLCITEQVESAQVPQVIERTLLQQWARHQVRTDPALAPLRATGPDALVSDYQKLDKALTTATAGDIIRACNARRARGDTSESNVIRREAAKGSNHMPVRDLFAQAGHLTQALKPCLLMPPPAASQHLPAGMRFDVVIFDEASQISPADAINCIYRGSAVILAGDHNQLPPARTYGSSVLEEDQWAGEPTGTPDAESVLDLAKTSAAFGNLTLRWHYRSRHEELIAYSNAAFYGGHLIPVPAGGPETGGPETGLELFYGHGTYRGRTSRDNPDEATRVAQRVIHHYHTRPGLSLGVVTFTQAQADAIETALAAACQQRPGLEEYFTTGRLDGFFVKTVETVQGDERDVLIVSTGYGPDEKGKFTTGFGPLARAGGWRRLNVAITRARYRTEIVTSIRPGDIPESVTSDGLKHLRRYLTYASQSPTQP